VCPDEVAHHGDQGALGQFFGGTEVPPHDLAAIDLDDRVFVQVQLEELTAISSEAIVALELAHELELVRVDFDPHFFR